MNTTRATPSQAILRITRPKGFADMVRAYKILVDDVEAGTLKAGTSIEIPVDAGSRRIMAKVDWCGSPAIQVQADPGETLELICESNLQGYRVFIASFYVFFRPRNYLKLTLN